MLANLKKGIFAMASMFAVMSSAHAIEQGVDLSVTIDIQPSCAWLTQADNAGLLTSSNLSAPVVAEYTLNGMCDADMTYTVKSDVDSFLMNLGGEQVTLGVFADGATTSPMASGPGVSGVATADFGQAYGYVQVPVYFKVSGEGAGGGFNTTPGALPLRTFNFTIMY